MSAEIDPAKLKVVELRQELSNRGLDSKGVKAALVKRLKDALEKELKQELPDTSIADTSTEDLDTSQVEEPKVEESKTECKSPKKESKEVRDEKPAPPETKVDEQKQPVPEQIKVKPSEETKQPEPQKLEKKAEENGDPVEQQEEGKARKSRWAEEEEKPSEEDEDKNEESSAKEEENKSEETKMEEDSSEPKGEKRKREGTSPERQQRRRSRSPIKEDEPAIDNDKVQLSWYDSDLHLQLDKESFLSAKPLHDGAFGYAWAGVRATHGISSGKICYEVKLTSEPSWEDYLTKQYEQNREREQQRNRDRYRTDHRRDRRDRKDSEKKSESKKSESDVKEVKDDKSEETEAGKQEKEESEEKMDTTEQIEGESEKPKEEEPEKPKEQPESEEVKSEEPAKEGKPEDAEGEQVKEETEEKAKDENAKEDKEKDEKMEEEEAAKKEPLELIASHVFRVGFSLLNTSLQLGEEKYSFGYESTGKFATDKQFTDYGVTYGVGDVVGAFLSVDDENVSITFTVNGVAQPNAITLPRSDFPEENFVLFPHVLSRNYAFELNLGSKEEPWFPIPAELEGYEFLEKVEDKVAGPRRPENRNECEVILMFGLPASGKTSWVKEHVEANPDKRFNIIGNTTFLDKMTVAGEPIKSKFKGRWSVLVDRMQKCLNKLIDIATLRRRNFIIDQTNVFPSAQRRKLRPFEGFKRRAVVIVLGDEEQARRQSLQEAQDGKDVPESSILEMKANMALPEKGEWLDEVVFTDLNEEEAKEVIKKYNAAGKEAGYGQRRFRKDDRWSNRRNEYHGGNYRDRNYQRYDRRPPPPGNWNRPGGWNRDRRDNRGPPPRDWSRNSRGSRPEHSGRDGGRNQVGSYNRPRSGGQGGGWQGGNSWGGQGGHGGGGGWGQQSYGSGGGYGQWGGSGQGQGGQNWKYGGQGGNQGGGGGYGGYGSNWNYYNQYAQQNWNQQGAGGGTTGASQYGQGQQGYTQQAWAQYAQQYAQQQQQAQAQSQGKIQQQK